METTARYGVRMAHEAATPLDEAAETLRLLGYAVVDELVQQEIMAHWVAPLQHCENPLTCMIELLQSAVGDASHEQICLGFLLHNLAQEMSPIDEGFRLRINRIYQAQQLGLCTALARGQKQGLVRPDIDPEVATIFIVAALDGCMVITKQAQDMTVLQQCCKGLVGYLQSLRA